MLTVMLIVPGNILNTYLIQFFHVLMINMYTMDFFWLKFGRFLYFYLARNITFHITVRGQSILVIFCSIRIIGNE